MGGEHFNKIISRGIPLVLFDRVLDDLDVHKIVSDDFDKVYEMVNHLIDSGYQNIAYLAGPSHLNITMNRLDGYKRAIIDNDFELILNGRYWYGYWMVNRWLGKYLVIFRHIKGNLTTEYTG